MAASQPDPGAQAPADARDPGAAAAAKDAPDARADSSPKDAAKDPHAYYSYMFEPDKGPTQTFDALLRAIGRHIVCAPIDPFVPSPPITPPPCVRCGANAGGRGQVDEIGDKNERALTPKKLAAFYRAVGGNYDCKIPCVRARARLTVC